jgi:dipeptidyl aminopeptidase/acylaminoacyl peptidase
MKGILLALAGVLIMLSGAAISAQEGGAARRVVFSATLDDEDWNLYLLDCTADACKGPQRWFKLTSSPGDDRQPAWSPGGGQIVFVSDRDGDDDLYLLDLTSGVTKQITLNGVDDNAPVWTMDGIIYQSRTGLEDVDILRLDTEANAVESLVSGPGYQIGPAISPDGAQMAYMSNEDGDWEIFLLDLSNGTQSKVTDNDQDDFAPAWLPDGSGLIGSTGGPEGGDLVYWPLEGRANVFMEAPETFESCAALPPRCADGDSGCGSRLAYCVRDAAGFDLYQLNLDCFLKGTCYPDPNRLTYAAGDEYDPQWQPPDGPAPWEGFERVTIVTVDAEQGVNLRNGPNAGIIASLKPGERVNVRGRNANADWLNVIWEDRDDLWVAAWVVTVTGKVEDLPVLSD